eukprot:gene426-2984_t
MEKYSGGGGTDTTLVRAVASGRPLPPTVAPPCNDADMVDLVRRLLHDGEPHWLAVLAQGYAAFGNLRAMDVRRSVETCSD